MTSFLDRLRNGPPVLLDGPTGTELERQGVDTSGPLWSTRAVRERPDEVRAVHAAYIDAGAEVLTTVTFRAQRRAFERAGLEEDAWRETLQDAVGLAREAARDGPRPAWVAGSVAPLADCYAPDAVPPQDVVVAEQGAQVEALAAAGPDLLLVETMNTIREAEATARAARETGLPVLVAFIGVRGGRLLSGESLKDALERVAPHADGVLVNCSALPAVADAIPHLRERGVPWGAYANGSLDDPRTGFTPGAEVTQDAYREAARAWLGAGARILGSCCGTGPEHTRALRALLDKP